MSQFQSLREKYKEFHYRSYQIDRQPGEYRITFHFEIPGLCEFHPKWVFPRIREVDEEILSVLAFHLGMVETISYWKCACPPKLYVDCGFLSENQIAWWKKLYFEGLGEFLYRNGIATTKEELVEIISLGEEKERLTIRGMEGCLVPVGGGKDSVVSLELLKDYGITTYNINDIPSVKSVVEVFDGGRNSYSVKRILDKELLERNKEGFLNGHTPFSAIVAFSGYIGAYLTGKQYIALSNETSANESTVWDSNVNHQYSKSFEFELDFMSYMDGVADSEIQYFSLLRPLCELQIAKLFAGFTKYHSVFRSCNVGSKQGIWCNACAKCLFVYIILSPYLSEEQMLGIFGENLLDKEELEKEFCELTGLSPNKPFECVGTRREVLDCLGEYIKRGRPGVLPRRYREYILKNSLPIQELEQSWVLENQVPQQFQAILKEKLTCLS